MSTTLPSLAHPGLRLASSSKYTAGLGTHVYDSHIYASLAGVPNLDNRTKPPTLSIPRWFPASATTNVPSANVSVTNVLPKVGSIVLAKVTRCMVRQINVAILLVDEEVCGDEWAGVVRKEDVRATEKEKVVVGDSFRPGDLIRAEVVCGKLHNPGGSSGFEWMIRLITWAKISLGDQTNYYLTTAQNELGVIMARSEAGNTMHPISWRDFKDPITGETEMRKVAKPV